MQEFRITYDGPALQDSRMDVRELAPALLAMGDLLDAATRVLHGDKVRPVTSVNASFKTGCFGIDFSLATGIIQQMIDVFSSREASAIANAAGILTTVGVVGTGASVGLFKIIKWIRNRPISRVEIGDSKATLFVDNEKLEIELDELKLLRSVEVRESVDKVLSPLDRDGIDTFAIGDASNFSLIVKDEEREWFRAPAVLDELILQDARKMAFSIVSLAFKDDNKWRLHDGNATIHATISDSAFLAKVDQNLVSFTKGDILICMVEVKQWQTQSGTKTDYDVTKVLEHRSGARQLTLPME